MYFASEALCHYNPAALTSRTLKTYVEYSGILARKRSCLQASHWASLAGMLFLSSWASFEERLGKDRRTNIELASWPAKLVERQLSALASTPAAASSQWICCKPALSRLATHGCRCCGRSWLQEAAHADACTQHHAVEGELAVLVGCAPRCKQEMALPAGA